jgi:hypothetical protein
MAMTHDTHIFCGCKPLGLCLTIIKVPLRALELAGADVRIVATEHADRLSGRVLEQETGYAVVEPGPTMFTRVPRPHTRRAAGAID